MLYFWKPDLLNYLSQLEFYTTSLSVPSLKEQKM